MACTVVISIQETAIEDNPWRDFLDLSAAAGPAIEERQEDDQEDVGQEDSTSCGNEWFLQRLSLLGYHLKLHGHFAVMPSVGKETANTVN